MPIGDILYNLGYFIQLGIGDLFSDSALADSEFPNPQLGKLFETWDLMSQLGIIRPIESIYKRTKRETHWLVTKLPMGDFELRIGVFAILIFP